MFRIQSKVTCHVYQSKHIVLLYIMHTYMYSIILFSHLAKLQMTLFLSRLNEI